MMFSTYSDLSVDQTVNEMLPVSFLILKLQFLYE
jgi:hypothetical protein